MERALYFAYGSNMDVDRMTGRCPAAQPVGTAVLEGWGLRIGHRGYATIVVEPSEQTWGALWSVTDDDLRRLDGFEGVARGVYHRRVVDVRHGDADVAATVYVEPFEAPGRPTPDYLHHLTTGAEQFDLPLMYRRRLAALDR